jgi:hypothetical protein
MKNEEIVVVDKGLEESSEALVCCWMVYVPYGF